MPVVKPILRIFDYEKAIAFYIDWLGFSVDWETELEPGSPMYLQVSRGDIVFHLSEHHGDGSPGIKIFIDNFVGLREFHKELIDKKYKYNRPGIEPFYFDPKALVVEVVDPSNNRLIFVERNVL